MPEGYSDNIKVASSCQHLSAAMGAKASCVNLGSKRINEVNCAVGRFEGITCGFGCEAYRLGQLQTSSTSVIW